MILTHNQLRVIDQPIALTPLPQQARGLRLLHISDLHFYENTDPHYYQRVQQAIEQLSPDAILLTGDVIHHGHRFIDMAYDFLSQLQAPLGCYAVVGNHDFSDGEKSHRVARMLHQAGFHVLRNAAMPLGQPLSATDPVGIWLVGLDDLWHGQPDIPKAFAAVPDSAITIVLAHNPLLFSPVSYWARAQNRPAHLVLSGHTHAGHVYLPFLKPIYRYVLSHKFRHGHYQEGQTQLYVTSGVGSAAFYGRLGPLKFGLPRFRFNTRPELVLLTLQPSEAQEIRRTQRGFG